MKRATGSVLFVLVLALGGIALFAQTSPARLVADVPFAFLVAGTEMPAGNYEVAPETASSFDLVIRNLDTGKAVFAPVLTRIGVSENGKAELVFDKVGDRSYLSEVLPSTTEGFVLMSIPTKHTHAVVHAS